MDKTRALYQNDFLGQYMLYASPLIPKKKVEAGGAVFAENKFLLLFKSCAKYFM
jgi:hypothetical protein